MESITPDLAATLDEPLKGHHGEHAGAIDFEVQERAGAGYT